MRVYWVNSIHLFYYEYPLISDVFNLSVLLTPQKFQAEVEDPLAALHGPQAENLGFMGIIVFSLMVGIFLFSKITSGSVEEFEWQSSNSASSCQIFSGHAVFFGLVRHEMDRYTFYNYVCVVVSQFGQNINILMFGSHDEVNPTRIDRCELKGKMRFVEYP
ncbi:hypothetical protein RF11_15681 [Thelohanellus kitauei]|uniref:Uncharacterized protein n=1 Tax=Thelohanellus kitauei TaxID=669202 RepID=A0A0C2MRP7_THEKT|nr:hypothetical protein RF11_15681 [Thelohanellus kitauei]